MVNAQVLQQLPVQIKNEQLDAAVNLLAKADNIYVIGLRRSFSVASYLTYALRHLERRAFLIDGIGGMFSEQLSMVSPDDVVIAISYSPYAQEVVELVELGAKRGAHHIAITDSQVSPLAAFSEVCFVVREAQVDGFRFSGRVHVSGANVSGFTGAGDGVKNKPMIVFSDHRHCGET